MRLTRGILALTALTLPFVAFAADSPALPDNIGSKDICYNETTYLTKTTTGGVARSTESKGPNFDKCKEQKITKADCKNPDKKKLVGTESFTDLKGVKHVLNRCETLAGTNTYCPGDSNCTLMKLSTGLPGGDPVFGATPDEVTKQTADMAIEDPQNAKVVLSSGCTNEVATCLERCADPSSATCPINQQIEELKTKGVAPENIYCMGSGGQKTAELDLVVSQACLSKNAQVLGKLTESSPNAWHGTTDDYWRMGAKVGEFEQAPTEWGEVRDFGGGGGVSDALPTKCGIDGISGNIMAAESNCGKINSNPLSTVSGPYHFLCPTWNTYAKTCESKYVDDSTCSNGYRNDTAISTDLMNCMNGYFEQAYTDRCAAAGVSLHSCQYAIHANGEPTFKKMLSTLESNPNVNAGSLCGSTIPSIACTNNFTSSMRNGSLQNLFAEYDRRLGGAGSFASAPAVSKPSDFCVSYGKGCIETIGSNGERIVILDNKDKGNGIFSTGYGSGGLGSMFGGMGMGNSLGSLFGNLFKPSQTQTTPYKPPPPPPPTASISILPNPAKKGQTLSVAWSSNGTSLVTPCQVSDQAGKIIATGGGGSQSVTTSSTTPSSLTFTVSCVGVQGGTAQQSATVTIQ